MTFFWIRSGEDGTRIEPLSQKQVEQRLDDVSKGYERATFITEVPKSDGGCWMNVPEDAVLIVKGEIVVPIPEKVVTQYKL